MLPPLANLRIVVTRAEHQAGGLAEAFAAAGATVELLPLLDVVPPADPRPVERAASELALYDWLVFTSANAVDAFLPWTGGGVPDRLRIAVVGPATAAALRAWEIEPHLIAARAEAEGLLAELGPHVGRSRRVLLPQAADARPTLADGLAQAGAEPVVVIAYDKALPADAPRRAAELFATAPIGWVTFTSPRVVRHFSELFGEDWERRRPELRAASIGPVTTAALRRLGVEPAAVAEQPGEEELVAAVVRATASGHR
ncbi:MAG TPA: uroporphyrinogen-III synthase [Thermoanaerobaculia bacterium]|jgi:uroporphyrinogen-III synthase|nr:uroporphyrinogen-III synthase [Thermoanaerobaculia bacterium]